MEIPVGTSHTETVMVDETNVASAVGSGMVDVFATPMMIALMELAAAQCLGRFLDEGMVSVGTHVNVEHSGATPVAMRVFATVTIVNVDRRKVDFDVLIADETGEVGKGTHTRFIVDKAKFTEKALAKRKGK